MPNLKDTVTTICGIIVAMATATGAAAEMWPDTIPKWILIIAFIAGGTAGGYALKLIGKNPNGTPKTPEQVAVQNAEAAK